MKRPNEKDYFKFRGNQIIIDYGHAENYIEALDEYIDYLENKLNKTTKKTIEERKEIFKDRVNMWICTYPQSMLNDFFDYWSEHNENGRKMKFEMQKTFDINLRLKQWHRRSNKSTNRVNQAW